MNKTLRIISISGLTLACVGALVAGNISFASADAASFRVEFYENYNREDFELSSGYTGKGNNLLYTTVEVTEGSLVTKPTDPTRKKYDFVGWYLEKGCETAWNFETDTVKSTTRLYAKWEYSSAQEDPEPPYTPPSTVLDESADHDYEIYSVMNFKIEDDKVTLPITAMEKLQIYQDNVLPLLEYKVKASCTFSATYIYPVAIKITCNGVTKTIEVYNITSYPALSQESYETKADKYEAKIKDEAENYHVMLAGSSSIEFWETSKEDLMPIVSYNHGIGGTTIEEWTNNLNLRLVYPYKPKMAVYYVGINNIINAGQTKEVVWANLETFFNVTHANLPNTKIQYIMLNRIPGFPDYFSAIDWVNEQCVEYQKSNTWLTLINPGEALLKENGEPNAAFFRTDGLHLSRYGSVVWGGVIKESILKGLEN